MHIIERGAFPFPLFFFFGYALYLFLCRVQRYIHPPSAYTQAHLPIPKTYFFWSQIVSLSPFLHV